MQMQKQGNIPLPQEFNQFTILTPVKDSNDHCYIEVPSKNFCNIFGVYS